jgi:hypothetical protein
MHRQDTIRRRYGISSPFLRVMAPAKPTEAVKSMRTAAKRAQMNRFLSMNRAHSESSALAEPTSSTSPNGSSKKFKIWSKFLEFASLALEAARYSITFPRLASL